MNSSGTKLISPPKTDCVFVIVIIFDGIKCRCIEGVLQAFKCEDKEEQIKSCGRVGYWAWKIGQSKNKWKKNQILYWIDKEYKRDSIEYQQLLNRLFYEVYTQNEKARENLLATEDMKLTHHRGNKDIKDTILTEDEFISRLTMLLP